MPYTDRYDEVALRDHSDLSVVARTSCFRRWTDNAGDLMVPSEHMFGLCTVLVKDYEEIRKEILHPSFSVIARLALAKIPQVCSEMELSRIISRFQDVFHRNEHVLNCTTDDLYGSLKFMRLYSLYNLSIEDPERTRKLVFAQFCNCIPEAAHRHSHPMFGMHRAHHTPMRH